jgi:hypothetical protein
MERAKAQLITAAGFAEDGSPFNTVAGLCFGGVRLRPPARSATAHIVRRFCVCVTCGDIPAGGQSSIILLSDTEMSLR